MNYEREIKAVYPIYQCSMVTLDDYGVRCLRMQPFHYHNAGICGNKGQHHNEL